MQKKGKRKKGYEIGGLRLGGERREAFIGGSILWIELRGLGLVVCGRGQDACAHVVGVFKGCGLQGGEEERGLVDWRSKWVCWEFSGFSGS